MSHGGYLVQAYTLLRPERVLKTISISGTVPVGGKKLSMMAMMKIFLPEALFPTDKNVSRLIRKLSGENYSVFTDNPEIMTGCLRIAELIGSMTIYLMENAEDGDRRIVNELSRTFDIAPNGNMTRSVWMTANVMNMLLYGNGNGICVPHTYEGIIRSLEPIAPERVSFNEMGYRNYKVLIDGKTDTIVGD